MIRYLRFRRGGGDAQRSRLLEQLLARADPACVVPDWRAEAFRSIAGAAPMPAVASVALHAALRARQAAGLEPTAEPSAEPCGAWVCLATPLCLAAELSNVRLPVDGLLDLDAAPAAVLAADFNRIWNDADVRLRAVGGLLFAHFGANLDAQLRDPETALGRHIEQFLPSGGDASRLKRLMSEMEMWLFDHAVNLERRRGGMPPVSTLWLWGGGPVLQDLPRTVAGAAGEDVFFRAFPAQAGQREDVIVLREAPGTERWSQVESRFLEPALEALRRGEIERLALSCGELCMTVPARWRWRMLRKLKPWWEYFE